MAIFESGEMYLENILLLSEEGLKVRAVDLSQRMGYSRASVSAALGKLKAEEFITVDRTGELKFTAKGREAAEKIYESHCVLTEFLVSIGVSRDTASQDACRIEHVISGESLDAIKKFMKKNA